MMESLLVRFIAIYTAGGGELYNYGYGSHFITRILPGAAYNLGIAIVFYLIMLLIIRIRRPGPEITYQGERGRVIDNAQ